MPYRFDIIDFSSITNPNVLEHINRVGQEILD